MVDFHCNIFYYYRGAQRPDRERERQLENNTTKALVNMLEHCSRTVAIKFLKDLLDIVVTEPVKPEFELQKASISKGEIGNKSQRLLLGIVPTKEIKDPCAELGRIPAGEEDSHPDAWIYGDNFVVLVESKVEGREGVSHELAQMERHYQKLLVDAEQQPDCKIITWAEVHRFFKNLLNDLADELTEKDKWIIGQFTQYLEWIGMAEFSGLESRMFDYFATPNDKNEDDRRWVRGTMESFAEKILEGLQAVDSSFYSGYDVGRLLLKDSYCWVAFGPKDKKYRSLAHQTVSLYKDRLDVFVNVELKPAVDRLKRKIAQDKQAFREVVSSLPGPFIVRVEERKQIRGSLFEYVFIDSLESDNLSEQGFDRVEELLERLPLPYLTIRRCIDKNQALELSQAGGRLLIEEVLGMMKEFHPLVEFINKSG